MPGPLRKHWVGPLNVHLSLLIILLLAATAVPLVWLSYDRGRHLALSAAAESMQLLTERTADRYRIVFDSVEPFVTMTAVSDAFATPPPGALERKQQTLLTALRDSDYIDGLFAGYPDGSFLHAVSLADSPAWRSVLNAPAEAAFALRTIWRDGEGRMVSTWRFLARTGRELSVSGPADARYDPRTRPWYQMASTVPGTVGIGPYVTATTRSPALTVARGHADDGRIVVGADIMLTAIASFLATEKVSPDSLAYVLDGFGKPIIHSDPAVMERLLAAPPDAAGAALAIDDPVIDAARAAMAAGPREDLAHFRFEVGGKPYLGSATIMRVSPSLEGNTLLVAAPLSDFTAESYRLLRQGLLISAAVLAIGIAATVVMANLITRSLSVLTRQAARLGDLDFAAASMPSSNIAEINSLASGLAVARDAISSFALYVPRELVRKIVANSAIASETAVRQEISVLFTDIRDFTTICEKTSPEEVVGLLSAYFDAINASVEANGGSIVQFLGDSVCAMWNAPIGDPDHAGHACRCALDIAATVERFNARQEALGQPVFVTRIGLHSGAAVVGNVGAASRLQYTAMGDTVNVASRLEGINKRFGTTILVSRAVVARCGDAFVFRPLGRTQAKGRSARLDIFELVGVRAEADGGTNAAVGKVGD
ncbi:adenylate/guanylate cyclase domain-containing protein [Mesorhizobium sp. L-8-3]|uniref:adenylate/guanylate cyclase domain-containing protein n=1 Tax=Mesorhizobium sp. L-8-3 TaxID=2744522 RepID=UPI0019274B5C|nr:adenylate/guanylate cyclase domain-containing protein [Mesorhizobium sp. L-8-3]BCH21109.1 adenylate/guanylate cyclase domain-containing protein [Mesorhizobium sp. L-8-3]